ncbi:oligosaccharide flippase family protein [Pseudoduganella sp. GCM10020061]|uniref:oligosaccharide flippase family protein n=1 Tax=Pseudoduganella sp. GCM10020061 TaxID=3317345 RepID=UPI003637314A
MSSTRVSLLFSFSEKYLLLIVSTAGTMVLARLLTPEETGIYSVAAVLVGLAQVLRDFGIGQYVIQAPQLGTADLRAVLGASYLASAVLALALAAASGTLAAFYGEPGIARVVQLLAVNILLVPLVSVTLPLLRREMRFGAVCAVNLASGVSATLVSVLLAWRGFGYASMAWGVLAGTGAGVLASLAVRPRGMPWLPSHRGMRKVFGFGAYATAGTLVDEAGNSAPDLIIGKMIGMEGAGLYAKAQAILAVFRQAVLAAVTPVLLPLYAARARESGGASGAFLSTVGYLTACAWPFYAFVAATAPELVRVLYGDQWDRAAILIRIMCIAAALYSMGTVSRYLLVAIGQVRLQARLDALAALARIVLLLAACGAGLEAAAWAMVATAAIRTWLTFRYLARAAAISAGQLARSCVRSALVTLASGAAALSMAGQGDGLVSLVSAACATGAAWLAALFLVRHPMRGELQLAWRRIAGALT